MMPNMSSMLNEVMLIKEAEAREEQYPGLSKERFLGSTVGAGLGVGAGGGLGALALRRRNPLLGALAGGIVGGSAGLGIGKELATRAWLRKNKGIERTGILSPEHRLTEEAIAQMTKSSAWQPPSKEELKQLAKDVGIVGAGLGIGSGAGFAIRKKLMPHLLPHMGPKATTAATIGGSALLGILGSELYRRHRKRMDDAQERDS